MKASYKILFVAILLSTNSYLFSQHLHNHSNHEVESQPDYVSEADVMALKDFDEAKTIKELKEIGLDIESEIQVALYQKKVDYILEKRGVNKNRKPAYNPNPLPVPYGPCDNAGFEFINWTYWRGATGKTNVGVWTDTIQTAGNNAAVTNSLAQHTLLTNTTGFDPYAKDASTGALQISLIPPGGGVAACRLGNSASSYGMERLRYKVLVTSANTSFTYKYAIVMQSPTGHTASNQPRFDIRIYDKNGILVPGPCGSYSVQGLQAATDTAFKPYYNGNGIPDSLTEPPLGYYKKWTTVSIDLSAYLNDSVTVEFENRDCNLGAHYGYAYIDASCSQINQTYSVCPNTSSITVSAPVGFNNYQWYDNNGVIIPAPNGNKPTLVINNPVGGHVYTVQMSSVSGCGSTALVTLVPNNINTVLTTPSINCFGGTVTASVSASGGTSPYTYSWVNAATNGVVNSSATYTNAPAGTYYVTTTGTGANGCTKRDTIIITQPTQLTSTISSQTNVLCNGNATGSATVNPAGGTSPYTYSWNTSPVQTTATINNLTAGGYTCTITDNRGCTRTQTVTISQPAVLNSTLISTNVSCNGGNSGTATVTPTGGASPYSYSWNTSPVQTTANVSNLAAGSYTCTITDNNGCTKTETVTISQPSPLSDSLSSVNVSCKNGSNGTATVTVSGGTAPYVYSWNTSPSQNTATATSLTAGTYTYFIVDAEGCTLTDSITITEPTALTSNITGTNVVCNAGNSGSASISVSGGTTPYTYSWNTSPVQTTSVATGLIVGTYICTVTDSLGCIRIDSVIITQPTTLSTSLTSTNVLCNGGASGTATVIATGGTIPYSYSWNTTPAQTTATATGLSIGNYTVTTTDGQGCTQTNVVTITQPSALSANASSTTNVTCFGGSNGSGVVTGIGGTSPYSYSWNTTPAQTTSSLSSVSAGTYTCTITDAQGCTITRTITIGQPTILNASSINTNVICLGTQTGTATASGSGATPPYTYSWNTTPIQTTATATNLGVGSYTCTITDGNGCTRTTVATIIANPAPIASFSANPISGTPPLTVNFTNTSQNANSYLWLFGDGANSTLTNPSHIYSTPGVYTVMLIASVNGACPDTSRMDIVVLENFGILVPNVFTPNNDGKNDVFTVNTEGVKAIDAEIYDRWGLKMYEWHTTDGGWDGYTAAGLPASDGTYYYIIKLTEFSGKTHYLKGPFTLIK